LFGQHHRRSRSLAHSDLHCHVLQSQCQRRGHSHRWCLSLCALLLRDAVDPCRAWTGQARPSAPRLLVCGLCPRAFQERGSQACTADNGPPTPARRAAISPPSRRMLMMPVSYTRDDAPRATTAEPVPTGGHQDMEHVAPPQLLQLAPYPFRHCPVRARPLSGRAFRRCAPERSPWGTEPSRMTAKPALPRAVSGKDWTCSSH